MANWARSLVGHLFWQYLCASVFERSPARIKGYTVIAAEVNNSGIFNTLAQPYYRTPDMNLSAMDNLDIVPVPIGVEFCHIEVHHEIPAGDERYTFLNTN